MIKVILIACLFSIHTLGFAQLSVEGEVAIPLDRQKNDFELVNLGKKGLLVFVGGTNLQNAQESLTVIRYDTLLTEQWRNSYPVSLKIVKSLSSLANDKLYLLVNVENAIYQIISLSLLNGNMEMMSLRNPLDLYGTDFKIEQFVSVFEGFVFGGTLKEKPAILHYDTRIADFKVLPNINYLKANIISIAADTSARFFSVLLASREGFYYNTYSNEGKLIGNNEVKTENKKYNFHSFQQYVKNEREQFVIGTYSFFLPQAQGVYISKFINHEYESTQYYSFNEFKNFYNHLDSTKRKKIQAKIKSNTSYRNEYEIKEQELSILDDKVFLVLRANKPIYTASYKVEKEATSSSELKIGNYTYKKTEVYLTPAPITNTDVTRGSSSRSRSSSNTVFDTNTEPSQFRKVGNVQKNIPNIKIQGYVYQNIITCTFDKNGKMLWDNAFDVRNIDYQDKANIQVGAKLNHISLLQFLNQKVYLSKAIDNVSNKDTYLLNSPINDLDGATQKHQIVSWYENQFIFIGFSYKNQLTPVLKLVKVLSTD
ncbi:MAG: hypothetical protein EAZ08_00610 [Cytophagales bacterium]|nr:MAG: hypothetical protein EAZ08_00610 [Cytophagales bacterium]